MSKTAWSIDLCIESWHICRILWFSTLKIDNFDMLFTCSCFAFVFDKLYTNNSTVTKPYRYFLVCYFPSFYSFLTLIGTKTTCTSAYTQGLRLAVLKSVCVTFSRFEWKVFRCWEKTLLWKTNCTSMEGGSYLTNPSLIHRLNLRLSCRILNLWRKMRNPFRTL